MQYKGMMLAVKDMKKSKDFYIRVLKQKVMMDMGTHVLFENGVSLQENYYEMVGIESDMMYWKSNNFQVYFDVEDLSPWEELLENDPSIIFLHKVREYPWGQRSMRVYDPDGHIVEIAEDIDTTIKRFLDTGMSDEEVAKVTMYPIEYIQNLK